MLKSWHDTAWDDYLTWQSFDKKILKKINTLIRDIERNGYNGLGKPEILRGDLSGWLSVKIDDKNRLIFKIINDILEIYSCKGHYGDK